MKHKICYVACTALILVLLLSSCGNAEQFPSQGMFVQSITTGSTLVMVGKGQEYKVTLCGVSVAPAQEAPTKKLLQSMLTEQAEERGVQVTIVRHKNNEITAEIYVPTANPNEEKSLNAELLAAGLARATHEDCPNIAAFQASEQDARERRVGMWK